MTVCLERKSKQCTLQAAVGLFQDNFVLQPTNITSIDGNSGWRARSRPQSGDLLPLPPPSVSVMDLMCLSNSKDLMK